MNNMRIFTSESVCEGHPDKICDLIADSILDEALKHDPESRVACEACCTTGMVLVMGEFTTAKYIDIPFTARNVIKQIGYDKPEYGFDYHTVAVLTYINQQSEDIALGITGAGKKGKSMGAGDQGMMFGYATNETPQFMPLPIALSHGLTKRLAQVRKSGIMDYLRPDGKAQVSVIYENNKPVAVDSVVVSCQHNPDCSMDKLKADVMENIIHNVIDKKLLTKDTKFFINPTGRFVKGGPHGDSGLTGRKIIVDTYGGMCYHGGGSFSGKDPTKVDRSAAYYARYVCKNVVAAGLADKCMLSLSYAIGQADPLMVAIDTYGTNKYDESKIVNAIKKVFDFRPYSIIKELDLRKPIYAQTTNYGHFGKDGLPYEKTDKVEALKSEIR